MQGTTSMVVDTLVTTPRRGNHGGRHAGHNFHGGRHFGNNTASFNGVDVSDPNRTFTGEEMECLGPVGRKYIFDRQNSSNHWGGGRP